VDNDRTIGRYRLDEELGQGATGVVYRATRDDGGEVALKLLRPEHAQDTIARSRFLREARIAGEIESPHVAPVLDAGEAGGTVYLVLPLYRSGSLAERLRERTSLGVDETVALAAQLGRGLDALHERGILHRDVKPSNVLLDGDTAALADFGLARGNDSTRMTRDGQLLGTTLYLAPELIEGADATRASDVYALGCVLYECLVSEPPFGGRSPAEVGFAHLVEDPPDPRERRPELPAEVAAALLTSLSKSPSERPTTATALARMLHLGHTPRPPGSSA
jgi:serine/threonine protein kinase